MMTKKSLRMWFGLLAFLLLTPWPVAYAYDNGMAELQRVQIEGAESSATPTMKVFGRAIGSVTPGDLFYIDTRGNSADALATLYLTNTDELIHYYRYLILKVGLYVESNNGVWKKASGQNGEPFPDTYLTLWNGQVRFALAGYIRYRVTIEGGNFYCFTGNADGHRLAPQFYLTVNQA